MSTQPRPPGFVYAKWADGTSLAYMRLGSGPTLVVFPPVPLSNVSGDWSFRSCATSIDAWLLTSS